MADISTDCKICNGISEAFAMRSAEGPNVRRKFDFGSFEEALSTKCVKHKPLIESFQDICSGADYRNKDTKDMGIIAWTNETSPCLTESIATLGITYYLILLKKDSEPNHIGLGRALHPEWADLDIIKQWKDECLSSHGAKCENPMKIWPTWPAWLIDIENECVVPGKVNAPYVALSYRWGNSSGFRVDFDNMDHLLRPNALKAPEISSQLPHIIRHAMHVASVLGERYIWIDALCIAHGDRTATAAQLDLMGAIYASAIVTIICADGDADQGLLGLKNVSDSRQLEQRVASFGDEKIAFRNTFLFDMGGGTEYYERGWTYQELKMATRKLLFNKKEVHWECQCCVWHEELTWGTRIDEYIDKRKTVILAGFPDMGSLHNIISNYNERQLKYDEDALAGISGLLSILSRSFEGGFLYGIPEMFFERALGWSPMWNHINLRRRIKSDLAAQSTFLFSDLPSWSWVGWQDLISIGYHEATRINERFDRIEETIPITEWYSAKTPDCSQMRRIRSTWYENRSKRKDFTQPLPPGWTRHPAPKQASTDDEPHIFPDGCGDYIFKHCDMPDDDCESWYYPFPVKQIDESTPPHVPEQWPFLFCKTNQGRLFATQRKVPPSDDDYNIVDLCNEQGSIVGELRLHNSKQYELLPQITESRGNPVELVAIYRCREYFKTFDEEKQRYGNPVNIREKYRVLWIEKKDGIAYRLAVGDVKRDEWEKLNLEEISLVLG